MIAAHEVAEQLEPPWLDRPLAGDAEGVDMIVVTVHVMGVVMPVIVAMAVAPAAAGIGLIGLRRQPAADLGRLAGGIVEAGVEQAFRRHVALRPPEGGRRG